MTLVPAHEQEGVMQALGLNVRDPKVQALALVAQRYGLDLILRQVFLIQGTVYVSHAGLLSVAHRSGDLDGIEVTVREEEKRWVAVAKVYRKSMRIPFTYEDECYKSENTVKDKRKRAITRAERNALRRAFDVGCDVWEDDRPEPPIRLSESRPEIPRRLSISAEAQPAGEGPNAPGLEASRATPEPSPAGPTQNALDAQRSIVMRCREMGLDDHERHGLVSYATDGRTESTKEITPTEAGTIHRLLHELKATGEKPWGTSPTTRSGGSSPPSSSNPARTDTSPEEKPESGSAGSATPSSS